MLTQTRLKEVLDYDPKSGLFSRVGTGKSKVGSLVNGYIRIMVDGKRYMAHRLAFLFMAGSFPAEETDHINGICDDNRWSNLREVTHMENLRNQKRPKDNTSSVVGVCWNKAAGKWTAKIGVKGKEMHLGLFTNFADAVYVRKSAEDQLGFHQNHGRG